MNSDPLTDGLVRMSDIDEIRKRQEYDKEYLVNDQSATLELLLADRETLLAKVDELQQFVDSNIMNSFQAVITQLNPHE